MRKILSYLAILIIAIASIAIFMISSTSGLKISIALINKTTKTTIKYEAITGTILGPIKLNNLYACNKETCVTANKASIYWQLRSLLHKTLTINNITADNVTVTLAKKAKNNKPKKTSKHQAITINLQNATINNIQIINQSGQILAFQKIVAHSNITPELLSVSANASMTSPIQLDVNATAKGSPKSYNTDITFKNKNTDIKLTGTGSNTSISLQTSKGILAKGNINAHLQAQWLPVIKWNINTDITNIKPAILNKDWPELFNMKIISSGEIKNKQANFNLQTTAKTPSSTLMINGTINQNSNVKWSLNSSKLNELFNNIQGSVQTTGSITGPYKTPLITGIINSQNISFKQNSAQSINSKFKIDLNKNNASSLQINSKKIIANNTKINDAQLSITGTIKKYNITATTANKQYNIATKISGQYINNEFKNTLNSLTINTSQFDNWSLTQPNTINVSPSQFNINKLCMSQNNNTSSLSCLTINKKQDDSWSASITSNNTRLSSITKDIIIANTDISGMLNFTASINGIKNKTNKATLKANIKNGKINTKHNNKQQTFDIALADINTSYNNSKLTSNMQLKLNNSNYIQASLLIEKIKSLSNIGKNQSISGSLNINAPDISKYNVLIPSINLTKGSVSAAMKLHGTIGSPNISGTASLENVSLISENKGLNFSGISLNIDSNNNITKFNGEIHSNNSHLNISGSTKFTEDGWPTTINIKGSNFTIIDSDEYQISASPNITINIIKNSISIAGELKIPTATIHPYRMKGVTTMPKGDIIYTTKKNKNKKSWETTIDTTVTLGDDVNVTVIGINGKTTGQVQITKQPNENIYGNGQVSVTGTYTAYGHELNVDDSSQLIFNNSSINNPTLNLSASKVISNANQQSKQMFSLNNVRVGIQLTGSINNPILSLYSQPATLSTSDILSYLILGHLSTQSAITATNGDNSTNTPGTDGNTESDTNYRQALANIIDTTKLIETGVSGSESAGITNTIQQTLGITELGIESNSSIDVLGNQTDQEDYFVVGKYLSPKIYIKYSQGLLYENDILELRYFITPHWILQLQSNSLDNSSGADILYST